MKWITIATVPMKLFTRLITFTLTLSLVFVLCAAAIAGALYWVMAPSLPSTDVLRDARLQVPLRVLTRDGELIGEFGEMRRLPLPYTKIPTRLINAFLAAEDDRFFDHPGFDYQGLLRAGFLVLRTGERRQGGSTITMQLARNFFLSPEKTYLRKVREIFLALRIESNFSKQDILELYLNKIYLGNRAYGVGAAAQVYYGVTIDNLSLAQTAMIAGLPKAPSKFNPVINPDRALERRNYVLRRMLDLNRITNSEYDAAVAERDNASVHGQPIALEAPFVAEMVRDEMVKRYGQAAYTDGYQVTTTIDAKAQKAANRAIRSALMDYDQRHGYRGPETKWDVAALTPQDIANKLTALGVVNSLRPAVVSALTDTSATLDLGRGETQTLDWDALKWARRYKTNNARGPVPSRARDVVNVGDVIRIDVGANGGYVLSQIPDVEGAIVSLAPKSGALLALVGGYDFNRSAFNRAIQAKRLAGSAFKPFLYSAALEKSYTPATVINDTALAFPDPSSPGGVWRPENYNGEFNGPTRMREGLVHSRNIVSIKILQDIGIDYAINYVGAFGFKKPELPHNLSLALGTAPIPPLLLTQAYATFANGGFRVEPYFIDQIASDREGIMFAHAPIAPDERVPFATMMEDELPIDKDILNEQDAAQEQEPTRVISPQNCYIMTSMMQDVVKRGTAQRALQLNRTDLAGKTGTTNDQRDAWFAGFNSNLVAVTWVGFDQFNPLGDRETGGQAALPMWMDYMQTMLEGTPPATMAMPDGLVTMKIDPDNGQPASSTSPKGIYEIFMSGKTPRVQPNIDQPPSEEENAPAELF